MPYSNLRDLMRLDFYPNHKVSSPIEISILKMAEQIASDVGKPALISEMGYPSDLLILGYSKERHSEYISAACRKAFNPGKRSRAFASGGT